MIRKPFQLKRRGVTSKNEICFEIFKISHQLYVRQSESTSKGIKRYEICSERKTGGIYWRLKFSSRKLWHQAALPPILVSYISSKKLIFHRIFYERKLQMELRMKRNKAKQMERKTDGLRDMGSYGFLPLFKSLIFLKVAI